MASHENTWHSCINCQITYLIWFSKPTYEVIREHNSSSALWRPKWGSRALWNSRNRAPSWHLSPHPQPKVLPSTQRPNMCSRLWLSWWKPSSQWTKFCTGNPSAPWPHIAVECVLFDIAMSNLKKLTSGLGKLPWGTAMTWALEALYHGVHVPKLLCWSVVVFLWRRQSTVFDSNISEGRQTQRECNWNSSQEVQCKCVVFKSPGNRLRTKVRPERCQTGTEHQNIIL